MALKPLRKTTLGDSDIAYFMFEAAEPGIIVELDPTPNNGTGKPGDSNNRAEVPVVASGIPLGMLVTEVVDIDVSQFTHTGRYHQDQVLVNNPVNILTHGYVYTDQIATAVQPSGGQDAYYTTGGLLTNVVTGTKIGTFRGNTDSDGYVGVNIDIP